MDNRPIGIMDSGIGGLTVAKVLHEKYPKESIRFLGDTLRNPYGERSSEEITSFSEDLKAFLLKEQVKLIIIACNTISFNVPPSFFAAEVPIVKMSMDVALPKGTREMAVMATKATISSHAHKKFFSEKYPFLPLSEVPLEGVAAAIEQGKGEEEISSLVKNAVEEYHAIEAQTAVLACTHYPLAKEIFEKVCPKTLFLDPALPTVEEAMKILKERKMLSEEAGENQFYFTDGIAHATPLVKKLFGDVPVTLAKL